MSAMKKVAGGLLSISQANYLRVGPIDKLYCRQVFTEEFCEQHSSANMSWTSMNGADRYLPHP